MQGVPASMGDERRKPVSPIPVSALHFDPKTLLDDLLQILKLRVPGGVVIRDPADAGGVLVDQGRERVLIALCRPSGQPQVDCAAHG